MKRNFLEDLGLEKETISAIMKEHGKVMQNIPSEPEQAGLRENIEALEQQKTELEQKIEEAKNLNLDEEIAKYEQQIEGHKRNMYKVRLASEYDLPLELADKLEGTTEEELKADAEQLVQYAKRPEPLQPLKSTEVDKSPDSPYRSMVQDLTN